MKNKIETLGQVIQKLHAEMRGLLDLSIGTHELVKRFDGYDTAIEKLKEEMAKAGEPRWFNRVSNFMQIKKGPQSPFFYTLKFTK